MVEGILANVAGPRGATNHVQAFQILPMRLSAQKPDPCQTVAGQDNSCPPAPDSSILQRNEPKERLRGGLL